MCHLEPSSHLPPHKARKCILKITGLFFHFTDKEYNFLSWLEDKGPHLLITSCVLFIKLSLFLHFSSCLLSLEQNWVGYLFGYVPNTWQDWGKGRDGVYGQNRREKCSVYLVNKTWPQKVKYRKRGLNEDRRKNSSSQTFGFTLTCSKSLRAPITFSLRGFYHLMFTVIRGKTKKFKNINSFILKSC